MHIVLFRPEIPPNTGNIGRSCAATQTPLHLIEPLGFSLDDRYLKRAGLDYWQHVQVKIWPTLEAYLAEDGQGRRIVLVSSKAACPLQRFTFEAQDSLLFGQESQGLPQSIHERFEQAVRIPMCGVVRSLNLATAAGIVLYKALDSLDITNGWD